MKPLSRVAAATVLGVGLVVAPALGAQASPVPSAATTAPALAQQQQQQNDDNDNYWGLFGLLGLAGLAGLMRRQQQRSDRPSAGRGPGT